MAKSLTTEAAVAKLMWLLPLAYGPGDVQRMFYTPISRDILL